MKVRLWNVKLRDDQLDCLIMALEWLIQRHADRIANNAVTGSDEFAHEQSRQRLREVLDVFKDVGHHKKQADPKEPA